MAQDTWIVILFFCSLHVKFSSFKPIWLRAPSRREISLLVSGQRRNWNFVLNPGIFLFCFPRRAAHCSISSHKHHVLACSEVWGRENYCFWKFFAFLRGWRVLSHTWFSVGSQYKTTTTLLLVLTNPAILLSLHRHSHIDWLRRAVTSTFCLPDWLLPKVHTVLVSSTRDGKCR